MADNLDALHSRELAHHMTIRYGKQDVSSLPLGQKVKLKVIGYAYDKDGLQTVHVKVLDNKVQSENEYPHVTVSHGANKKPVESNALMVVRDGGLQLDGPTLNGTVGYYLRGKNANHFYTD